MGNIIGFLICLTIPTILAVVLKVKADIAFSNYKRINDRLDEIDEILENEKIL